MSKYLIVPNMNYFNLKSPAENHFLRYNTKKPHTKTRSLFSEKLGSSFYIQQQSDKLKEKLMNLVKRHLERQIVFTSEVKNTGNISLIFLCLSNTNVFFINNHVIICYD